MTHCNKRHYHAAIRLGLAATLTLTGLLWDARALAASCTGWGTDTNRSVDISLSNISIPYGTSVPTTLVAGESGVPGLVCTDDSGQVITNTAWTWLGGSDTGDPAMRGGDTAGIKMGLTYTRQDSGQGTVSGGSTLSTQGFDWQTLTLSLYHSASNIDISSPALKAGPVIKGVLKLPDGSTRTLTVRNANAVYIVPECQVDNIPVIDFGNVSLLRFANVGDIGPEKSFTVGVTCPSSIQTGSMTLSLSATQTDGTDPTLLGNTGTATGIAIEVLDGNGNRINAGGTVTGAGFVTATSQTWRVRFVRTGAVSAGSVRATATINVTVQ